ncbi:hypothetical protein GWI33_014174 [Rhynchophorus ferrugineus]|uniref:C-type lectin domain-containing protein n=1 Tax=Rhynchophorus ferrugineus TaxID=354439 RepID=A0A834I261_RHYFE|nr:hypothetical protein GWI33_014174 [Rhynchophorus ferrugineus]
MLRFLLPLSLVLSSALALNRTSFLHSDNYHVSTVTATFPQGLFDCKRLGWVLAIEEDAEETSALNTVLTETGHQADNIWLGGVYQEISGFYSQWIWIENGKIIEYTNWQSGEPSQSSTYPCIRKDALTSSYPGQWYANNCESNSYYFICQGD